MTHFQTDLKYTQYSHSPQLSGRFELIMARLVVEVAEISVLVVGGTAYLGGWLGDAYKRVLHLR